jgi:hypothetical protein
MAAWSRALATAYEANGHCPGVGLIGVCSPQRSGELPASSFRRHQRIASLEASIRWLRLLYGAASYLSAGALRLVIGCSPAPWLGPTPDAHRGLAVMLFA